MKLIHVKKERWSKQSGKARLQTVSIGQEFVLDCDPYYPKAMGWVRDKIEKNKWQR